VSVVSRVCNHKQLNRLPALQVGDRKVCSLANFNFGDGSHNGWSIAAGYEPFPVALLMQPKSLTSSCVQLQQATILPVLTILGGTVSPSVHVCRNTGANGSAARQKLAASTEHRLKSAENLRMPKVPMGICHLSHTPAWALCVLHWSFSFSPSGPICRVHTCLLQLSTWLLCIDLLTSVMY